MKHGTVCRRALWGFLAAAAIIVLAGSHDASAQQFEYAYGSANCVDGGLHGVQQLAGGGYVAVGESFQQPGGACGTSDAYVVVTNTAGAQVWSATYQVGFNSRATDVLELANGDLIVCGYGMLNQPCNPGSVSNDIFVLHLAPNGALLNANTYGSSTTSEEAWTIIETTVGDNINTFPGDFVIAGSSTNQNAPGMRGGYLLRINAGLGLIWDRQYGTANNDDYFYGVAEVPAGFNGAGDIVATGGSTSPPAIGTDIFTIRVNGNNATIGAAPQNESWTNFPAGPGQSVEVGRAVVILRNGRNAGDIVVAGYTSGAPAPSTNDEVFVVEFSPDPCKQIANVYFGDNGPLADRGYDLVEDANPTGDVLVTGFTNLDACNNGSDVFLQRVSTGPGMGLVGPISLFGGNGPDEGWSVNNAANVSPTETPGYVVNGMTRSANLIGPLDPQQLYLIKTDLVLRTGCERQFDCPRGSAPRSTQCSRAIGPFIGLQCVPPVPVIFWQSGVPVCPPQPPPPLNRQVIPGDGAVGNDEGATISFNNGLMTSYPNPLRGGDVLNLSFESNAGATAHVVVHDVSGRETYHNDVALETGAHLVPVSTDGWPAGTYLVQVTVGAATATSRVVLEK